MLYRSAAAFAVIHLSVAQRTVENAEQQEQLPIKLRQWEPDEAVLKADRSKGLEDFQAAVKAQLPSDVLKKNLANKIFRYLH